MDISIIWVILSSLGSMIVAIILGVASYFVKRYIGSNDRMKADYYNKIGELGMTVLEIKNLIETQNLKYDNRFGCLDNKIKELNRTTDDHEVRIGNVEKEVFKK